MQTLHQCSIAKCDIPLQVAVDAVCCLLEVSRVGCTLKWVAVVGEQQHRLSHPRLLLHAAAGGGTASPASRSSGSSSKGID